MGLAAVVVSSCHKVLVAMIPVLVPVVVLAALLSFCPKDPRGVGVPPQWFPAPVADGSRNRSHSFPPLDTVAGRTCLSLGISMAISCFSRYPHRRPAGLSVSANGSLDIDQVWLHWGRHQGISRQLLHCITAHAFGSEGHRRFLLRSDEDGHTWVSVAESLRGLPRRHRRCRASRAATGSGDVAVTSGYPTQSRTACVKHLHLPKLHNLLERNC